MSNKDNVLSAVTSLKDGAYKQAKANEVVLSFARFVHSTVPAFLTAMPDEVKAELYAGYKLRYCEINKGDAYARIGDNYILIDGSNPDLEKHKDKINITVDYAFSFTSQQFGKLRGTDTNLHALIKIVRDKASSYCSNRLKDLTNQVKELNPATKRQRGITDDFTVRVKKALDDLTDKCKVATSRGDETANEARFKKAKLAFLTVWNHAE